jgi:hypothetical protein
MQTFHFFPPSSAEQRSFMIQLFGTILTAIIAGTLAFFTEDVGLRAAMVGLVIGAFFLLARSAFQLEIKAQRAQNAAIGADESGLQITDAKGQTQTLRWDEIESTEVVGGRLQVKWRGGEIKIGAREIESGMKLINLIAKHTGSTPGTNGGSNFIPLNPK